MDKSVKKSDSGYVQKLRMNRALSLVVIGVKGVKRKGLC